MTVGRMELAVHDACGMMREMALVELTTGMLMMMTALLVICFVINALRSYFVQDLFVTVVVLRWDGKVQVAR